MKSRLLVFFLFSFSFLSAQVATFNSVLNSYNIAATSATISNIITSSSNVTVYYQLATGSASNVALSPTYGGSLNSTGTWTVPFNLSGLTPNTTYYFRFRADNASGTSYSTTGSFTTLSAVPTVTFTNSPSTYNSTSVAYSLNANGLATTSLVRYGLASGNLSNQATGSSSSGTSAIAAFANLSGLLPSTTYYFQIEATNSAGTSSSPILSFTTDTQAPGIYSVSTSSITTNSATINYSVWDKELTTTSLVRYGLSSGSLTNQVAGFSVSGNATISGNASLTGLNPATTYYYQVEATNAAGISTSNVASFTTLALPSQIANYPFNNSLNNSGGNNPFSAPNTTFVTDRASQMTSAIRIGSTTVPSTATIPNLPIGNTERTISFWHKKPTHTTAIGLFAYGTGGSLQTFGVYLLANGNYVFQGSVTDYTFTSSATAANAWIHTVVTYKNGVVKLYNNGVLVGSTNLNLNTGSSTFRLGGNQAIVEFDDLQIYNYELNVSQVGELYNNNVLASSDFSQNNLEVKLYPNPVRDILNIEIENDIQSIEIYNIQGQKVLSSNQKQINVSDLATGMYMVRIQDIDNKIATKKIVIK
ncbi:fibronectin type III domain-containing protein [Flavobacterium lacisediminis]|uniref:Fibronectin type III domain-containing protein n=1 Tax=Flavobacterium lacisediminis TaxID=2989705 RepID=A0ABT3EIC8_9FLAO|nr:fibronectin type III domain-containing protein [Flavobacterium lacisediminis]MCW1148171.1 fibronectin type III domain-containing protein [Flavobacterium lacisediminis]